jgi:hypothetical protein
MVDAFYQAAFCQPARVLGRQLRPFSLSHFYLLRGLGNGYVVNGVGTRSELFTVALVCSRTHRQNARAMFGGASIWPLMLWAALWPDRRLAGERAKLVAYLADYCKTPEHWEKEGSASKGFRAPWAFHFVRILTDRYGCTLDEAWDTPVSLARCLWDVWAESEGDDSLITEEEHRQIELVNAQ